MSTYTVNAINNTTYQNCQNITSVDLQNIPWVNNSMYNAFVNCTNLQEVSNINNNVISMTMTFGYCTNLVNVPIIPNSVTNMSFTFSACSNLVNTPVIPNSVTNISYIFQSCTNLINTPTIPNSVIYASDFLFRCPQFFSPEKYPEIPQSVQKLDGMFSGMTNTETDVPQWCLDKWNNCSTNVKTSMAKMFYEWNSLVNAPVIPNSVTDMQDTFGFCRNLVNAPEIPNSVTNMYTTFSLCSNLITAPNIPESVTNMTRTFYACNNLIGNVYIHSKNIIQSLSSMNIDTFSGTTRTKNVYIPYFYENGKYTKTYNSFTNGGYDEIGTQHGVYLKDLATIEYPNVYSELTGPADMWKAGAPTYGSSSVQSYYNGTDLSIHGNEEYCYSYDGTHYTMYLKKDTPILMNSWTPLYADKDLTIIAAYANFLATKDYNINLDGGITGMTAQEKLIYFPLKGETEADAHTCYISTWKRSGIN